MRKDPTEFRKRFAAWKDGKQPYKGGRPSAVLEVDKSDADFAERLRSNWRQETWDWEGSGKAVTHKIGSADNIVYPNVQTTKGGGLIDFTNPIWKGVVDPLNRAIINKDYVPMKTELDAIWFGPNYKEYYPKFKDGKLPGYLIGKPVLVNGNPTNAQFNSDGTFTDDITKVFDDFYVTPSGVTTKYGSHTDKNWDRYKQLESFYKYRDLLTGKLKGEPGLEIVSPEFDVVSAARAGLSILKPKSKLLQKSFADVNNSIDIAKEPYINIGTTSFDIAKESPTIHELNKYAKMLDPDGKGNRISGPYASIKKFLESPAYRKRLEKYYRDKGSSIITQNVAPDDRISELLYNIETAKLKVMPKGKLINAEGEIKDAYGMYDPNSHSIQIASDAVLRNTPEHEMWHAARRARAYLDNAKYKMRVRSLSDLNYYGDMSEQEVRVLDTLREMQESGLDINNLTDDQIWNFFYETPIDSHGTNVQSLIDNYWYDDVKNALRNFKGLSIPVTMGIGYTKLKPIQTMKSE